MPNSVAMAAYHARLGEHHSAKATELMGGCVVLRGPVHYVNGKRRAMGSSQGGPLSDQVQLTRWIEENLLGDKDSTEEWINQLAADVAWEIIPWTTHVLLAGIGCTMLPGLPVSTRNVANTPSQRYVGPGCWHRGAGATSGRYLKANAEPAFAARRRRAREAAERQGQIMVSYPPPPEQPGDRERAVRHAERGIHFPPLDREDETGTDPYFWYDFDEVTGIRGKAESLVVTEDGEPTNVFETKEGHTWITIQEYYNNCEYRHVYAKVTLDGG